MKKVFIFAAAVAVGMSACQKAELADNNLPVKQKATFAPVSANIRVFNSDDDVLAEVNKIAEMSFVDLCAYENSFGFNSFGKNADFAYDILKEQDENFKSIADVRNALTIHSEYLQLLEDNEEYTLETKLYDSPFKYIVNNEKMYQVQDTLVKVLENAVICAPIENYKILLSLDEAEIEYLKVESRKPASASECTFLYEAMIWGSKGFHVKVYDCYGVITYVTSDGEPYFHDMSMGRKFELKDYQTPSDGRTNRMNLKMKLRKGKRDNTNFEYYDIGSFSNKTYRLGKWKLIYWLEKRDVELYFDVYTANDDNYGLSAYRAASTRYGKKETTAEYYVYFPDTNNEPYFEKTRGYIRAFSGSNTINFINLNRDNY
ncbi:MAG: hypothetical protein LBN95_10105 [Prevotellaceae bacterium]|jgi:hypothetical protein|nr:hypothetical protein [Prevotellaceae bacterium]